MWQVWKYSLNFWNFAWSYMNPCINKMDNWLAKQSILCGSQRVSNSDQLDDLARNSLFFVWSPTIYLNLNHSNPSIQKYSRIFNHFNNFIDRMQNPLRFKPKFNNIRHVCCVFFIYDFRFQSADKNHTPVYSLFLLWNFNCMICYPKIWNIWSDLVKISLGEKK